MIIQRSEARELCSEAEWKLVGSSFPPVIETLGRSDVKSRLERVTKLHRKTTELIDLQHSPARQKTTGRKAAMLAAAVQRLEIRLKALESTPAPAAAPKVVQDQKTTEKQTRSIKALQDRAAGETAGHKRQSASVLSFQGEQQKRKSGARAVQAHVGAVNRREQGRRDSKNR